MIAASMYTTLTATTLAHCTHSSTLAFSQATCVWPNGTYPMATSQSSDLSVTRWASGTWALTLQHSAPHLGASPHTWATGGACRTTGITPSCAAFTRERYDTGEARVAGVARIAGVASQAGVASLAGRAIVDRGAKIRAGYAYVACFRMCEVQSSFI